MGFGALIIGLFFMVVGMIVSARLKSKFHRYSQVHLTRDLTGADVARLMLADNGIHDVLVTSIQGELTDHYNPANKTVNLSEGVYHGRNAAATAIAAHECGHAVQHAKAYNMLELRSATRILLYQSFVIGDIKILAECKFIANLMIGVKSCVSSLISQPFHDTFLIKVSNRGKHSRFFRATHQFSFVLLNSSGPKHFVLPISFRLPEGLCRL